MAERWLLGVFPELVVRTFLFVRSFAEAGCFALNAVQVPLLMSKPKAPVMPPFVEYSSDQGCCRQQSRRCWTESPQGATLLLHRLHRHGVGRGAVSMLPGDSDRCRARLLRHRQRCTAQCLRVSQPGLAAIQSGHPPIKTYSSCRITTNLQAGQGVALVCLAALRAARQTRTSCSMERHHKAADRNTGETKNVTSPPNRRGS